LTTAGDLLDYLRSLHTWGAERGQPRRKGSETAKETEE
jgi:hypothetical protein